MDALAFIAAGAAALMTPYAVADPSPPVSDQFRAAAIAHGVNATDPAQAGIWKAAIPAGGSMHGEFANDDPIGLAAGVQIWADCSINWVDPDSGRRYCFSSATSLVVFLETPHTYLVRAVKNWNAMATSRPGPH